MDLLVKDWMNPRPLTVDTGVTVAEAKAIMDKYWIRHLIVLDGAALVGILSDRDIRTVSLPPGGQFSLQDREAHLRQELVSAIMTRGPRAVRPDTPIRDVARLMLEHKFGSAPVVEGDQLVGIITETDILRAFMKITEADPSG